MRDHPIFHEPPQSDDTHRVELCGTARDVAMRFYVWQDVLEEIWFASTYREGRCAALLTGLYGIADSGPFIEVTGFEGLEYVDSFDGLLESFQPQLEAHMSDRVTALGASVAGPVGFWAHDPEQGALLSEELARLHLTLFNVPYQVALLTDASTEQLALYARPPRSRFFGTPFYLVSPTLPGSSEQE